MSRTHAHACIIAPCSSRGCADVAIHHRAYAVPYDKPFLKVFKGGGISLKGQQSQLLCSSPLTLENNEIFKKSNQTIPRYTRVRVTSLRRLEKEYKNEEGKEKQRDGRNNIIFPRERTPFAIGGCTLRTENLWGSRAGTRDPSTRDEFEPGEPKRVALWVCKCMSHARATHARSLVRIPERCERAIGAEGWFPPHCAILLHPLVLIHRIVKWRWPNLLLYRIMVILRGQRWERCDRMRDSPILPLFSIVFWMKILRYISR